jgi:hypothetical protein
MRKLPLAKVDTKFYASKIFISSDTSDTSVVEHIVAIVAVLIVECGDEQKTSEEANCEQKGT